MKYMLRSSARSPTGGRDPEEMRESMERWRRTPPTWRARGVRRRRGPAAERDGDDVRFDRAASRSPSTGPFAETKEQLGGFYLIDAPISTRRSSGRRRSRAAGGAVEVRPVMDYERLGSRTRSQARPRRRRRIRRSRSTACSGASRGGRSRL